MTLLERDAPLARLADLVSLARTGRGSLLSVTGEAGIGKTALLTACAAALPGGVRALWGWCEPLSTPRPLGPLVDIAPGLGPAAAEALQAGAPRHRVFAAVYADLASAAGTTLVVIEDVHWADEATLDLLRYLGRRLHRLRAVLVVTARSDEVGPDHALHGALGDLPAGTVHHLVLAPLSLQAVSLLATDAQDAGAVHALTGGNPFLVTELLAAPGGQVPATVRAAVMARRATLAGDARQVVDLVSVMPSRPELGLLRTVSGAEPLSAAIDAGLLTVDGRSVGFRHELSRLAVLESLPPLRVEALHRLALEALGRVPGHEAVLARLVHHAVGAADADAVRRFAPAAAQQAAALGAHREAAAHHRTLLAWTAPQDLRARAEAVEGLAYELYLTGDIAAAREARRDALAAWRRLQEPRAVGRNVRWLSRLAWFLGDRADANARADEALAVLSPLGEDAELAMALSNRAQLHMLAQQRDAAVALGERAIAMARHFGSAEILSHALNNVGSARAQAGDTGGRAQQEESLRLALDADLHEHAARAFTNLASCAITERDYAYAARWLDPGINYSAERDLDSWRLYMLAWRARYFVETGRWTEAEADARAVIGSARTTTVARIPALAALALLRVRQGAQEAGLLLDEALALALPTAEAQRLVPVRAARAEQAWLQGRYEVALAEADAGLAVVGATADNGWDHAQLQYWRWRAGGGPDASAGTATTAVPYAASVRGDWRAAADDWERRTCPYERAEALADGDVAAMEQALELFLGLGAAPAADRVRQRLREAGIRRRGARATTRAHPAGLTRREAEILGLLAERLSNPAIAERLFVSAKTVEHHVSALLGKLDVTSRDAAVARAHREGWLTPPPK